ncbi:MAG: RuBisCO large subunit C-terminal-like domain-containing protein, partial [Elusimicrobiota bacterium]
EQQIPMLLTATIGNISLAGKLKLVDLRLPEKYLSGFTGPKFGIKGIRDLLSVQERPLLNNMIKPCTGYPVEVGEKLFFEAAIGGADIIKDDELLANMSFNKSSERVKRYLVLAKKKYEETGEKTLYTVNITDDVPKIFENANRAVELGANAIMINYLAVGLTVLKALSEDKKINVPVLAHMDVAGAMYESPYSGISSHLVLGKLPRLAGADIVVFPAPYGKAPILPERYLHIANTLTYPMKNIKETWPMPSGGITPQVVSKVIKDLGTDIIIGTGGGIHAHPRGPRAGAKAFRQAIDAAMKGVSIEEAAKQHEELRVALEGVKPSLDTFL